MNCSTTTRKSKYNSYDPNLKRLVAKTGNISLATNKGVPRTTAIYWAQNIKTPISKCEESLLKEQIKKLDGLLEVERAKVLFISNLSGELSLIKQHKKSVPKKVKNKVIREVEKFKKYCTVSNLLSLIGLHISRYYKWKSEVNRCLTTNKFSCAIKNSNQLTHSEVLKIIKLASSQKYQHFSLTALWKFSLRHAIIVCSRDTWFKYINTYQLHRQKFKFKKTKYKHGVRATRPNEKWHLDLTEFDLISGTKLYLQAIIDNYIRYIVDWSVSTNKKAINTTVLIKSAKRKLKTNTHCELITDLGTENRNISVQKILLGSNIEQVFARKDIRFSNSMIEAFFRTLKNNFLYYKKIKSINDFKRQVSFFIYEYNNVIPHSCFTLQTPDEVYHKKWDESQSENIDQIKQEAIILRRKENLMIRKCGSCLVPTSKS